MCITYLFIHNKTYGGTKARRETHERVQSNIRIRQRHSAGSVLYGCAGSATKESTGGYIDDTVITTKVKATLFNDKSIKSSEISVETFKGRVQLSGFVSSAADAKRAVEITRRVKGVRMVENDMRIK